MFDVNNNGLVQKAHLLFNSCLSKTAKHVCNYTQQQIVVCGFPRSGTSLLYNMLSVSFSGFKFMNFEKYFIFNIHKLGNIASKAPFDIFHIKDIDRLNINNKKLIILVVVRDIRDIVTSRHPMCPDRYFIGYDHSWWPQDKSFSKWSYNAPGILRIHQSVKDAVQRHDVMLVKYEDLVADPDKIQKDISQKYELTFDSPFSEFHKNPAKHAYQYKGRFSPVAQELVQENQGSTLARVKRWKTSQDSLERVKQQFSECPDLFSVLKDYGYETSRDWFRQI